MYKRPCQHTNKANGQWPMYLGIYPNNIQGTLKKMLYCYTTTKIIVVFSQKYFLSFCFFSQYFKQLISPLYIYNWLCYKAQLVFMGFIKSNHMLVGFFTDKNTTSG